MALGLSLSERSNKEQIKRFRPLHRPNQIAAKPQYSPNTRALDDSAVRRYCSRQKERVFKFPIQSAETYSAADVHLSDHLTTYELAEPAAEEFCVLVKTTESKIEWHPPKRGPERLAEFLGKAEYVASQIKHSRF